MVQLLCFPVALDCLLLLIYHFFPFFLLLQVEADLGYPGGKAKIIHKESDIIMAFAINKVSSGDLAE